MVFSSSVRVAVNGVEHAEDVGVSVPPSARVRVSALDLERWPAPGDWVSGGLTAVSPLAAVTRKRRSAALPWYLLLASHSKFSRPPSLRAHVDGVHQPRCRA